MLVHLLPNVSCKVTINYIASEPFSFRVPNGMDLQIPQTNEPGIARFARIGLVVQMNRIYVPFNVTQVTIGDSAV